MTELLFSYGTLQLEAVQMATFGRLLSGKPDVMTGFEVEPLAIDDPSVIAISGKSVHTIAKFTGRASDEVPGTVFELTSDEVQHADAYEVDVCQRVPVVLKSGVRAWVYVDRGHTPPHA